jgi:cell division protein ZapA
MNKPVIRQIDVQIMNQSYVLACPSDGEGSLMEAVRKVDSAMCRIRDAGKVKARDRIAVLAALNIAFELSQKENKPFNMSSFGPTESGPAPEGWADPDQQLKLQALLGRLDQALGEDGQLL